MAARRAQERKPFSIWVALAGIPIAGVLAWQQYPSVVAVVLSFMVAGWLSFSPELTGRKDYMGVPSIGSPREEQLVLNNRFWTACRTTLLPFGGWFLTGWPVRLAALWAASLALLAALIPTLQWEYAAANAFSAWLLVTGLTAARRRSIAIDDICPGVTINSLPSYIRDHKIQTALSVIIAAVAAGITFVVASPAIEELAEEFNLATPNRILLSLSMFLVALLAANTYSWNQHGLKDWRRLVEVRAEWKPRWQALRMEPFPFLQSTEQHPGVTVDTFEAASGMGSMAFLNHGQTLKTATTLPANIRTVALDVPADGPNGPMPGTIHPRKFRIVAWDAEQIPDIRDPALGEEVAHLLISSAVAWGLDPIGFARAVVVSATRLTTAESPAVWMCEFFFPNGPSLREIRPEGATIGGELNGATVAVDHKNGVVFIGADPEETDVEFDEAIVEQVAGFLPADPAEMIRRLLLEDLWNRRWSDILKMSANPPEIQHATAADIKVSDGQQLHSVAFVVKQGVDPAEFRGLEPKIATTLRAAPFVAVTGFPASGPGTRHPQGFRVIWSHDQIPPAPQDIKASQGAPLILSGMLNRAFDAVRLARPELMSAQPLAVRRSPEQIWEVRLKLYGGVTASDLRNKERALQSALQAAYFRVVPTDDRSEVVVIFGEHHRDVELNRPERDELRLEGIDWDYFFGLANLVATGGERPLLISKELVEDSSVELFRYVFRLPGGMTFADVKMRTEAIQTASEMVFVLPRIIPGQSSEIELLVGPQFPIPDRVSFNFDEDFSKVFVVGQGVMGRPVGWSPSVGPHCLISGSTGSGKSVAIQSILYCAAEQGWMVLIADPTKGGADFGFVEPYTYGFVDTINDTALMLQRVYEVVLSRKKVNAANRVGSYKDLPEEMRPRPMLVAIDEFFSLVAPVKVPPKTGDPQADTLRDNAVQLNYQKAVILDLTGRIAREARSAGTHMVIAAQRPDGSLLEGEMKFNFSERVLMGTATSNDRRVALKSPLDAPDVPPGSAKGRGVVETSSGLPELIQGWYADQSMFAVELEKRIAPVPLEERLIQQGEGELMSAEIPDDEDWVPPAPSEDIWSAGGAGSVDHAGGTPVVVAPVDEVWNVSSAAQVEVPVSEGVEWSPRAEPVSVPVSEGSVVDEIDLSFEFEFEEDDGVGSPNDDPISYVDDSSTTSREQDVVGMPVTPPVVTPPPLPASGELFPDPHQPPQPQTPQTQQVPPPPPVTQVIPAPSADQDLFPDLAQTPPPPLTPQPQTPQTQQVPPPPSSPPVIPAPPADDLFPDPTQTPTQTPPPQPPAEEDLFADVTPAPPPDFHTTPAHYTPPPPPILLDDPPTPPEEP